MVRAGLLLVALLVQGWSAAQLASSESVFEADPGGFVSIFVTGEGDAPLTIEAPEFLRPVSSPRLRGGRSLVNLLVAPDAPAGEHQVRIGAPSGEAVAVTVRVSARTEIGLRVPEGATIVRGDSVSYAVAVTNLGNVPQSVELRVRSRLRHRLGPERLDLAAGETQEVVLVLDATGRDGRDLATVTAIPLSDPAQRKVAHIRTTILPFAGAAAIEGPAMHYELRATASYGSSGLAYSTRARFGGQLSDYVDTEGDLLVVSPRGGAPSLSGNALVAGDRWEARYRGAHGNHRFDARYHDLRSYAALAPGNFSFGVSYTPSPLSLTVTHRAGGGNQQTLSAGYRVQVIPEFSVTPTLSLSRSDLHGDVEFSTALGLSAELQTQLLIGVASFRLPLNRTEEWNLAAAVRTRSQAPFGIAVNTSLWAQGFSAGVTANEVISEELSLQQRLSYHTRTGSRLGLSARYRPLLVPLSLSAGLETTLNSDGVSVSYDANACYYSSPFSVGARFRGQHSPDGSLSLRYGASANYRPSPFSMGAYVNGTEAGEWTYGGSVGYRESGFGATLAYAHSPRSDRLSASLVGNLDGFTGSASYAYDLTALEHRGNLRLEYEFPRGHQLFSSLTVTENIAWQVGASFVLAGGFATPDGVVSAFGGRAVGFVTGVLFHDENRNGVHDPGEPTLPGATVISGGAEAATDPDGRFRLALAPGAHALTVQGLSASFGVNRPLAVDVELGQTYELDVPVETVAAMIVRVFDDRDRDGTAGPREPALSLAAVTVQGPDGVSARRLTDSQGEAVFQGLPPGPYTVSLDPASLPLFYEPTTDPPVVTLEAGPILRLELGATEREKDIVQTLRSGDLTLVASVEPMPAPPGADVLVVAQVGGEPEEVKASLPSGDAVILTLEDGSYRGRVSLPQDAQGVLMLTVEARRGDARRAQQIPVIVAPGSLAELTTSPTLTEPGEAVRVEAKLLTLVRELEVVVEGVRYPLEATDDPYRFVGTVPAPTQEGSHLVELFADGEKLTETRFRVQ